MIGLYTSIKHASSLFIIPYLYHKIITKYNKENEFNTNRIKIIENKETNIISRFLDKYIFSNFHNIIEISNVFYTSELLFLTFENNTEYYKQFRKILISYILCKISFDLTKNILRKEINTFGKDRVSFSYLYFSLLPLSIILDVLIIQNTKTEDLFFMIVPYTSFALYNFNKYLSEKYLI